MVEESLQKKGYFVCDSFLSKTRCIEIKNVFCELERFQPILKGVRYVSNCELYQVVSDAFATDNGAGLHSDLIALAMSDVMASYECRAISDSYWGGKSIFGTRVQFSLTKGGSLEQVGIPFCVHYDRVRFLKFYLYLDDISSEDGAFEVSNQLWIEQAEFLRAQQKEAGAKWNEITGHILPGHTGEMMPLELPAGSLVIFDSNQPHRHGTIRSNKWRNIVMLESQPVEEVEFYDNRGLAG